MDFFSSDLNSALPSLPSQSQPAPTPPASAQSLIALLTGRLDATTANNLTLSRAEVQDLVLCLQRATESEAAAASNHQELVEAKSELGTLKAHCRLGDYEGTVFNHLKTETCDPQLPGRATDLATILMEKKPNKANRRAIDQLEYVHGLLSDEESSFCERILTGTCDLYLIASHALSAVLCHL